MAHQPWLCQRCKTIPFDPNLEILASSDYIGPHIWQLGKFGVVRQRNSHSANSWPRPGSPRDTARPGILTLSQMMTKISRLGLRTDGSKLTLQGKEPSFMLPAT